MTKKTYKAWTDKEHNRLATMHENKLPIKEIAKALNRTPSSVTNRISKIKKLIVPRTFLVKEISEPENKGFFKRLFGL